MDLIPVEHKPRPDSLYFLTQVWRNLGTFKYLKDPITVQVHDTKLYLAGGNHRAIWHAINGIHTIDAREEVITSPENSDSIDFTEINRKIQKENRQMGIFNIYNLAARVENPAQYDMKGPIRVRITVNDLLERKWFNLAS